VIDQKTGGIVIPQRVKEEGRMKKIIVLMVISLFLLMVGPVYAIQIFSDDFNRANSNTVGNAWLEYEHNADDVAIVGNYLQLRDEISGTVDASASRALDLSLYKNITISFAWRPITASEADDYLIIDWTDTTGTTWTEIFKSGLGSDSSSWNIVSARALPGAPNIATFQIRLWTDVSESNEGANIDYITLNGDLKAVPEPTTMLLLGFGLLGLGAVRRKN
jgi:hypothetical protein